MAQDKKETRRGGLGRGLAALIPTAPEQNPSVGDSAADIIFGPKGAGAEDRSRDDRGGSSRAGNGRSSGDRDGNARTEKRHSDGTDSSRESGIKRHSDGTSNRRKASAEVSRETSTQSRAVPMAQRRRPAGRRTVRRSGPKGSVRRTGRLHFR